MLSCLDEFAFVWELSPPPSHPLNKIILFLILAVFSMFRIFNSFNIKLNPPVVLKEARRLSHIDEWAYFLNRTLHPLTHPALLRSVCIMYTVKQG